MSELLLVFPLQTVWWRKCFRQVLLCGTSWRACDDGCSDLILNHHVAYFHLHILKPLLTNLINLTVLLICLLETSDLKGIEICHNFFITLGHCFKNWKEHSNIRLPEGNGNQRRLWIYHDHSCRVSPDCSRGHELRATWYCPLLAGHLFPRVKNSSLYRVML